MTLTHIFIIDPVVTNEIYPYYEDYSAANIIKPKHIFLPDLNSQ